MAQSLIRETCETRVPHLATEPHTDEKDRLTQRPRMGQQITRITQKRKLDPFPSAGRKTKKIAA
jgi:hypothetical protein